ncbi:class I SAM-dependent methyltransferase [Chthoniobacter flavus]|uniref:class I SAM-dependent methyltransferase n=1 Tax=Chthoniobacter flavus TaxID=191863 RepID=UPI000311EFDB|nr:methyltransferase domain-containing protein [Chthoniobacter flavus]
MARLDLRARLRKHLAFRAFRARCHQSTPLQVVIGAGSTEFSGWVSTDLESLDVTLPQSWKRLFRTDSIDRLLAEHIYEHLDEAECRKSFRECFRYLKPGGLLRIAVPDGHRRDSAYVAEVSPPKDGHKMLFTVESLRSLLEEAGFQVTPLEYFDASEQFHHSAWDPADGMIRRSLPFDTQEAFRIGPLHYTSLIMDARKPNRSRPCAE